jgi:hypothetical protein
MNLDRLFTWITAIVLAFAVSGRIDLLQKWIWSAQARALYDSRTATWGSPRFFPQPDPSSAPVQFLKKNPRQREYQ